MLMALHIGALFDFSSRDCSLHFGRRRYVIFAIIIFAILVVSASTLGFRHYFRRFIFLRSLIDLIAVVDICWRPGHRVYDFMPVAASRRRPGICDIGHADVSAFTQHRPRCSLSATFRR